MNVPWPVWISEHVCVSPERHETTVLWDMHASGAYSGPDQCARELYIPERCPLCSGHWVCKGGRRPGGSSVAVIPDGLVLVVAGDGTPPERVLCVVKT